MFKCQTVMAELLLDWFIYWKNQWIYFLISI
jgi:hypothetical protein